MPRNLFYLENSVQERAVRSICGNLTIALIDLWAFVSQTAKTILTTITSLLRQFGNRKKLEAKGSLLHIGKDTQYTSRQRRCRNHNDVKL